MSRGGGRIRVFEGVFCVVGNDFSFPVYRCAMQNPADVVDKS